MLKALEQILILNLDITLILESLFQVNTNHGLTRWLFHSHGMPHNIASGQESLFIINRNKPMHLKIH